MKLKANQGPIEIKALGIRLTQDSTSAEIENALKHAPELEAYVDKSGSKKATSK